MKKSSKKWDEHRWARWVSALMSSEVFPVDKQGRKVGKAVKVSGIEEAHAICDARNARGEHGTSKL